MPTAFDGILENPGIGFQTTRKTKNEVPNARGVPIKHATFRLYCKEVNPSPGVFNWSYIDTFLANANAQGQKVQLGLVCYDPDGGDWMKNQVPGFTYHCNEGGGNYFTPDWDSLATQLRHRELIQAFANKYNNDARVESIDVRSWGSYGEWHNYCLVNNATGQALAYPTEATRRKIIQDYRELFTSKPLITILDDTVSRQEAIAFNLGWRADCWGGTQHEQVGTCPNPPPDSAKLYCKWMNNPDMNNQWRTARVDLEPCGSMLSTNFPLATKVDQALAKHASMINTKNAFTYTDAQWVEIQRLLKGLGYRYSIDEVRIRPNNINITWKNTGVAPCYGDYKLTIKVGSSINERTACRLPGILAEGADFSLPTGNYPVRIAITKDGIPAIRLANVERDADGWMSVGTMTIP